MASLAFGSSTLALSTVLAVFFAGLAIGSFVIGRRGRTWVFPLRGYAWLELGVGCIAIASPFLFAMLDELYSQIYPGVFRSTWRLSLARFVMVSVVLLPATAMMGGSLPLFCYQFVRRLGRVTTGVGVLYGINTLGAACGAAVCGFWMMPTIGINASLFVAGSLNLSVSLVAFRLARPVSPPEADVSAPDSPPSAVEGTLLLREGAWLSRWQLRGLAWIFFGVGFVAVANEVLWTRFLSLWMPNTVYTYTVTLSVVLIGIVVGSLLASLIPDTMRLRAWLLGFLQLIGALSVMLVMQLPPKWWGDWFDAITPTRQLIVVSAVMLLPSVFSGACFPLAVGLASASGRRTGELAGRMTAINLMGCITGSIVAGFFFLPVIGLHWTLMVVTATGLVLALATWWQLATDIASWSRISMAVLGCTLWIGIPGYFRTALPRDFLGTEGELVDYREGVNANVSVIRKGDLLHLEINRMWQGQNVKNHQVFAAHIPCMLNTAAKKVLVIGLGTGQTAGSFTVHDIERLDCIEIEDGLIQLVEKHFDAQWMKDPRVHMLIEDGRNYVTHTSEKYDIISIEVGQIYRPRIASFYTVDFYRKLRPRLNRHGVVCQFLPIEFFGQQEFRTLVATFCEAFPESILWYNTSELLLIGSNDGSMRVDVEQFARSLNGNARLKADFDTAYWGGADYNLSRPEAFVAGFLCGPAQLKRLSEGGVVYQDDRPYLEYMPISAMSSAPTVVELIRSQLTPFSDLVDAHSLDLTTAQRIRSENLSEIVVRVALAQAQSCEVSGDIEGAFNLYSQASQLLPNHPKANLSLANFLQAQNELAAAIVFYQRALTVQPENVQVLYRVSQALVGMARYGEAEQALRRLIGLLPDHPQANALLGSVCRALGKPAEAALLLEHAMDLEPNNAETMVSLASVLLNLQQPDRAVALYEKAVDLSPGVESLRVTMGWAFGEASEFEAALGCFEDALTINPRSPRALLGMANVFESLGQTEQAQQQYLELIAMAPDMIEAIMGLALALQSQRRFDEALRRFERALELAPEDPYILTATAWLMATHPEASKRNAAEAVRLAELAWENPAARTPQAGDVLAAAYAASGRFEEAVATCDRAIDLARKSMATQAADQIESRKKLYERNQAYSQ